MKRVFIKIGIYAFLAGLVTLLVLMLFNFRNENKRLKTNFDIELRQELDRQQKITKNEFKKYFSEFADTLKNYGIKPNRVENVIQIKYNYKDTLIPKYVLKYKDTLIEYYDTNFIVTFSEFDVSGKCHRVTGYILADSLMIESIETNDKLLVSLYKEKRKCLFAKRGIKAIAISECKGDTLEVLRNLKVGK